MKNVFVVINGESQNYFIEQANAEKHAENNGGELFQEEISNRKFEEHKKQKGFFLDLPVMEVKKNGADEMPQKTDDLKKLVQQLQEENENLKKVQKLSYQDAAELYKKKAQLLRNIGRFEEVQKKINDIELTPSSNDDLSAERHRIVLQSVYGYSTDEKFAVSNIFIISEFIDFISEKVQNKIEALKVEVQEL